MNDMPGKTGIEFAFRRFIFLFTLFISKFSLGKREREREREERLHNYHKISSIILNI